MAAPEVEDLSTGSASPPRRAVAVPRLPAAGCVFALVAGLLGAASVRGFDARRAHDDAALTVSVASASPVDAATPPGPAAAEVEAGVTLELRVSVPVRVIDAELDGAPPISRVAGGAASRTPSVLVRWRVLCAEVGTIPGPRLLDLDVATSSGSEHRRVGLAHAEDDPVSRVFHLAAAARCTP